MSKTPITDAYEIVDGIRYVTVPRKGLPDMAALSRRLESDRAELIEALRRIVRLHDLMIEHGRVVIWEQKEDARALLARLERK